MSTGLKANSDGSAAIQVGGTDVITLTSGGAATFVTSPTTVQAGTAAAPSITFSGDTNTGIYSPGADQVAIATGGSQRAVVDASGNLDLSSGNLSFSTSGSSKLSIFKSASSFAYTGPLIFSYDAAGLGIGASGAAPIVFGINNTERMRIDSAGNVGIGTTSPAKKLDVYTTGTSAVAQYVRNATVNLLFNVPDGTQGQVGTETNHVLLLLTNNIERGRFDTSGNFLFNSGYGSVATAYGCRAWVNFNGTLASPITPRGSGNVSSVTKSGTGVYVVNFTSAMPDTNYATNVSTSDSNKPGINSGPTTGAIGVTGRNNGNTLTDLDPMCVSVFR